MPDHCSICGRGLRNPVSVTIGIGPVCRSRLKVCRSEGSFDMFMPDFSYHIHDGVLIIEDLNLGGLSVTNGAEAVINRIGLDGDAFLELPVIYRDTEGRYDRILVENGKFAGFTMLDAGSESEALEIIKGRQDEDL